MAERIEAFKGYHGKLYATEREADASFFKDALAELGERIEAGIRDDYGPKGYGFVSILRRHQLAIMKFYELDAKVHPNG